MSPMRSVLPGSPTVGARPRVAGRASSVGRAALRLVAVAALGAALGGAAGCGTTMRFVPDRAHGFVAARHAGRPFHVYLPSAWSPASRWPVIVYLHGGGERGDDGVAPTQVGLGPVVADSGGRFPAIVVFPQCPKGAYWASEEMERVVLDVVDEVVRDYAGDLARVYLTGNSLGGYGTWIIGARNPTRFAALVPLCGGIVPPFGAKAPKGSIADAPDPYAAAAQAIGALPVWAFHGADDWLVSPTVSRRMVAALRAHGNAARYTELPGVGHAAEETAYRRQELFDWLLAQHR